MLGVLCALLLTQAVAARGGGPEITASPSAPATTSAPTQVDEYAPEVVENAARKRGVAWQMRDACSMDVFAGLASYYTYGPFGYESPLPFVPQLWGCEDAQVAEFRERLERDWAVVGGNHKSNLTYPREVFAFNEPNESVQANCSPVRAAKIWKDVLAPLQAQGWRVGTPAVNANTWNMAWMLDFWRACDGCEPDFLALHYYNPDATRLPATLEQWRRSFNYLPVQVTEIAPMFWPRREEDDLDLGEVKRFMQSVNAWMDATPWVEKYYWYGAWWDRKGLNPNLALLKSPNVLSELGEIYVAYESPRNEPSAAAPISVSRLVGVLALLLLLLRM